MIANFFNKANPLNVFLLIPFVILVFGLAIYKLPLDSFTLHFWLLKSADLGLVFILILIYYFIVDKNRLTASNHYGLLFFCLLFGLFYPLLIHTKFLVVQVILAFAFKRIYSLRINQNIKEKLFDSTFLIGITTMFFQECGFFILLSYAAILAFRRAYWNFVLIPIVGFVTPYFLIYIYSLSTGNFEFFNSISFYNINFNLVLFQQIPLLIYIGIIFIIGLTNYMLCIVKTSNFNAEFRGLWRLIFAHFLIASILLFFGNQATLYNAAFLIFPTGVIMANYLQTITVKWRKEVLVFILIAIVFSGYLYNFKP